MRKYMYIHQITWILKVGLPAMLVIRLKFLFTITHMFWVMYILGLRSSWGTSRVRPSWSPSEHLMTPALSPFRGARVRSHAYPEEIVYSLMTAAHISPNVFSLQMFLSNVQWISHYSTRQLHAHILYITFIRTFTSYVTHHIHAHSHLHFFWSSWPAGYPWLLVSDTCSINRKALFRTCSAGIWRREKSQFNSSSFSAKGTVSSEGHTSLYNRIGPISETASFTFFLSSIVGVWFYNLM
jgi:hypothetical protein